MVDIAHISGLVVTKQMNNPFEYCDIVTSTTHKHFVDQEVEHICQETRQ